MEVLKQFQVSFLLALLVLSVPILRFTKAQDAERATKAVQEPEARTCRKKESIALLASSSRVVDLVAWLKRNSVFMIERSFIVPAGVAQLLRLDPATKDLEIKELTSGDGTMSFDILVASEVLSGKVSKVVVFKDPTVAEQVPDLDMLMRACETAKVPLAVNEAAADMAIRSFAGKSRMAYLIFNPVAGQGIPEEQLELIYAILEPQIALTVVMTKPDVDPAIQAKEIVDTIKARPASADAVLPMILASGGDGTVSAVAGATMGTGIPFGVIPRGTANAFSVALGIPTDVKAACYNILQGAMRVVDGAMVNDVPMILLAGIGFEAGMVENAPRSVKDVLGPVAYVLGGVKQFFAQEPFKCNLEIDGAKSELMVGAITVATVAPPTSILAQGFGEVIPDDGLLDVTIGATSGSRLEGLDSLARLLASAVVKEPTESDALICVRAKEIKISCDPKQKIVVDGEILEMDPITFSVLPGALNVVAPPLKE